jgi:putative Holliday junction resolvase
MAADEIGRKVSSAMAVCNITEIKALLPPGRRIMGLDVGTKTIGLALSDLSLTVATPFETLRRGKFTKDAGRLAGIVEAEEVGALVIGLPLSMDGTEGPKAQSVRQFAVNLGEHIDIPIALWDERLSTAAVTRTLLAADASRKRRAEVVDKLAAAYILQGALDRLANL